MQQMVIERGEIISCFVFSSIASRTRLPAELELRPGLWLSRHLPAQANDHWREGLGTLTMRELESGALIFTAKGQRRDGKHRDETLRTKFDLLWYGSCSKACRI
jgi:hypothetical protein